MKMAIGGLIAIVLGVLGLFIFFPAFLKLLAGVVPVLLILGGGLAIYLKHEDQKSSTEIDDNWKNIETEDAPMADAAVEKSSAPAAAEKAPPAGPGDNTAGWVGNTGSHVFHTPDCKFSKSKNCTAVFSTREDAVKEGYKPCSTCNP